MIYQIILINGRVIEFEAEEYEYEEGTYTFYMEGDIVGQFQRNNIAGFCRMEIEDED